MSKLDQFSRSGAAGDWMTAHPEVGALLRAPSAIGGGHAAGLRTARYRVDRATPKRAAISATGMSAVLSSAWMVLISLAESLAGRPPFRPRARAAFRPATARSRIKVRSNSASAAKT